MQRRAQLHRTRGQRIVQGQVVGAGDGENAGPDVWAERRVEPMIGGLRPRIVAAVFDVGLHMQGLGDSGQQRLRARGRDRPRRHAQTGCAAGGEPIDIAGLVAPLVRLRVEDHQVAGVEAAIGCARHLDGNRLSEIAHGEGGWVGGGHRHAGRDQVVVSQAIEAAAGRAHAQGAGFAGWAIHIAATRAKSPFVGCAPRWNHTRR